ncbi:MAG: L-seryl-tRNA(Sec) selenium transferase [Desulfobulbaceae bacterium]|nr:L-seryl-tRNA(Sec) selenium transferase [Desulfobulbaceae bacterium]
MLPSVQHCLAHLEKQPDTAAISGKRLLHCCRVFLSELRQAILSGERAGELTRPLVLAELHHFVQDYHRPSLRRVINATGVIIHTNLGRSLLPPELGELLSTTASSYSNLELNLKTGKRGSRYNHVEALLCELTGAEAALVVNNNAAAVLLALETLAKGKEVVVSRGQLVEIGGSFRIPDVMARSGAKLVEVGATNRTHLADYQVAINPETALLLKVHCSNYRIIGFTGEVPLSELVELGRAHGLPVMEDLGSGCLVDLSRFGLIKEPTVQETIAAGADLATFSGDKLLGGPQAGILVGRKEIIRRIQKNPLNRALRIDKLTLATLEAVLRLYLNEEEAFARIPTLRMISEEADLVKDRGQRFVELAAGPLKDTCHVELCRMSSLVGGGALPAQDLVSWGVACKPVHIKAHQLERWLRQTTIPVLAKMEHDTLYLDMRTIAANEVELLLVSLQQALAQKTL